MQRFCLPSVCPRHFLHGAAWCPEEIVNFPVGRWKHHSPPVSALPTRSDGHQQLLRHAERESTPRPCWEVQWKLLIRTQKHLNWGSERLVTLRQGKDSRCWRCGAGQAGWGTPPALCPSRGDRFCLLWPTDAHCLSLPPPSPPRHWPGVGGTHASLELSVCLSAVSLPY